MMVSGFEGFAVGQVFTSAPLTLSQEAITSFAAAFDHQPQHTGPEEAVNTMFGRLVASGWHTSALTMRLLLASAMQGVSGRALGIKVSDLTWVAPVYPGDSLYAETEVLEVRPSRSRPDRGIVVIRTRTRNQHDQAVQEMTSTLMVLRSDAKLG